MIKTLFNLINQTSIHYFLFSVKLKINVLLTI